MGRLTERDKHGQGIWVEEFHSNYNFFDKYGDMYPAIEKLAHYEDLEEQGRLIELPCAVGDTVYFYQVFRREADPVKIFEGIITSIDWNSENIGLWVNAGDYLENIFAGILGKHVFLTKEEALAKLKELEGE